MSTLVWPCVTRGVSDDFDAHRNRRPPSTNPGTDIVCGYGEIVWAVGDGVVTSITNDTNSAAGRYLTIALDAGGYAEQKLHLSRILVSRGQRVSQFTPVAHSGASGFGSEYGYGAHLHQTLRLNGSNVDFEKHVGSGSAPAGGSASPIAGTLVAEGEDMYLTWSTEGHGYLEVPGVGVTYVNEQEYNLLFRTITSNQKRTPFAEAMKPFTNIAELGKPHIFSPEEIEIKNRVYRRIAGRG